MQVGHDVRHEKTTRGLMDMWCVLKACLIIDDRLKGDSQGVGSQVRHPATTVVTLQRFDNKATNRCSTSGALMRCTGKHWQPSTAWLVCIYARTSAYTIIIKRQTCKVNVLDVSVMCDNERVVTCWVRPTR